MTEEEKEKARKYRATLKGKEMLRRHRATAKSKATQARYWASPKGKAAIRRRHRKRRYGMSEATYVAMWESQGGRCANSGCHVEIFMNTLKCNIDHCHQSNRVRGLLCNRCNIILGFIENSAQILDGLKAYISRFNVVDK